jgi:hypothetical protein
VTVETISERRRWFVARLDGRTMESRVAVLRDPANALVYSTRVWLDSHVLHERIHPTRELAESDADEQLTDLIAAGWIRRDRLDADSGANDYSATVLGLRCAWCGGIVREPHGAVVDAPQMWTHGICPDCEQRLEDDPRRPAAACGAEN